MSIVPNSCHPNISSHRTFKPSTTALKAHRKFDWISEDRKFSTLSDQSTLSRRLVKTRVVIKNFSKNFRKQSNSKTFPNHFVNSKKPRKKEIRNQIKTTRKKPPNLTKIFLNSSRRCSKINRKTWTEKLERLNAEQFTVAALIILVK